MNRISLLKERSIPSIDEMRGSVKTKKILSKKELKKIIAEAVVKKFLKKDARSS